MEVLSRAFQKPLLLLSMICKWMLQIFIEVAGKFTKKSPAMSKCQHQLQFLGSSNDNGPAELDSKAPFLQYFHKQPLKKHVNLKSISWQPTSILQNKKKKFYMT